MQSKESRIVLELTAGALLLIGIVTLAENCTESRTVPPVSEKRIVINGSEEKREAGVDLFLDLEEKIWGS